MIRRATAAHCGTRADVGVPASGQGEWKRGVIDVGDKTDGRGHGSQRSTVPLGHHVMFLVFAFLAFYLYAPTVMFPIIQQHCELLAEEQRLQEGNAALVQEINRQKTLSDAFENDATINRRLAVLDLHYRAPGEEMLTILPRDYTVPPAFLPQESVYQSALMIPHDWPAGARQLELRAESWGLINLFLDGRFRPAFLLMACGLVVAAFVLFAPRPSSLPIPSRTRAGHPEEEVTATHPAA